MPLRQIDRELLDRCLQKETGAWNDFVDRYMGLIYHVIHHVSHARSVVLSAADIEDIAAEIFLAIVDDDYGVLRRFKGPQSYAPPTYLDGGRPAGLRQGDHQALAARPNSATPSAHRRRTSRDDESTWVEAESIATAEEVDRMLENLPEREAEVVRLYHLKYLNYRQISKQLGIAENSVGPILAKARPEATSAAPPNGATQH